MAVAGLVFLLVKSIPSGAALYIVSSAVFGASMIFLYLTSTMTHWLKPGQAKEIFFTLDQIGIFLLIAGTYTPLSLIALKGTLGWIIFSLEWGLAIAGIIIKLLNPTKFDKGVNLFYITLYVVMGWMVLIAIGPLYKIVPLMCIIWILIGGMSYSIGIYFYRKAKFRNHHLIWHLMVMAGTISHFFAIFFYIIPAP